MFFRNPPQPTIASSRLSREAQACRAAAPELRAGQEQAMMLKIAQAFEDLARARD